MSRYRAVIAWRRDGAPFAQGRYSRGHRWMFDGGAEVPASSSPQVVPLPYSVAEAVDPEEALVASLSSCHMLWFLSIACKSGFVVEAYRDEAEGLLGKDPSGQLAMTKVTLRPEVRFGRGKQPDAATVIAMHREAHTQCFIARSVKTEVCCEPANAGLPAQQTMA